MNAVLHSVGLDWAKLWPDELEVHVAWSWEDWALGLCTEFYELGFVALVLGPLHLQLDWAIG